MEITPPEWQKEQTREKTMSRTSGTYGTVKDWIFLYHSPGRREKEHGAETVLKEIMFYQIQYFMKLKSTCEKVSKLKTG